MSEFARRNTADTRPGSCRGRGPRAASWFQDECDRRSGNQVKGLYLEGGIKGWVSAGDEYTVHMAGYDAACWTKPAARVN